MLIYKEELEWRGMIEMKIKLSKILGRGRAYEKLKIKKNYIYLDFNFNPLQIFYPKFSTNGLTNRSFLE